MPINHSPKPDNPDIIDEIIDAKNRIVNYLQARISEIQNSLQGERPDENGRYSDEYYQDKDKRDQLNKFISIVLNNETHDSLDKFIQSVCQDIQNFPDESYKNLFRFIEEEFGIKIHPMVGPPMFYKSWVSYWADECGVTPEEVEKIMPYEKFQKFEQQNDTAARIEVVMNAFGKNE